MSTLQHKSGALRGFVASMQRIGARPALQVDHTTYTYDALGHHAARIAATIMKHSSGDTPFVGLLAHRSLTAYSGVLGILGAGKGYVPLNPKLPVDRLLRILTLAGPRILIVGKEARKILDLMLTKLPAGTVMICPDMEDLGTLRALFPQHCFIAGDTLIDGDVFESDSQASMDSIAYLLFTSGSTGDPKGVPVRHKNLRAYVEYIVRRYEVNEHDRFSQMFDMSFDLSVHDMFICWEGGGCLYAMPEHSVMAPGKFIRDHKISMWFSVPSVIGVMEKLGMLKPGAFPTLRASLFCGEPLLSRHAQAWQAAAPNSFVENLYGPTETTIAITHYRWDPEVSPAVSNAGITPIGRAFAGQRTCVVNPALHPVTSGESGELCLSGSQVTQGYLNNPEQTRKQFVTLMGKGDEVWYRTGDLVREDADGCLHYLGRIDHQVKVRGHRIELQEIEFTLREASGSQEVAALAWPVNEGIADGIVGFVAGTADRDSGRILQYCRQVLPDYMIPSAIYFLEALPLNVHGKTDRLKLRELIKEGKA
jgi:amino acid adenylation domain-containing protein